MKGVDEIFDLSMFRVSGRYYVAFLSQRCVFSFRLILSSPNSYSLNLMAVGQRAMEESE